MGLFTTKPIDHLLATSQAGHGLRRVLGSLNLVALGIGAIIGTGIFVLSGQTAAANAGPAMVISMVIAGVTSALAALSAATHVAAMRGPSPSRRRHLATRDRATELPALPEQPGCASCSPCPC